MFLMFILLEDGIIMGFELRVMGVRGVIMIMLSFGLMKGLFVFIVYFVEFVGVEMMSLLV